VKYYSEKYFHQKIRLFFPGKIPAEKLTEILRETVFSYIIF
jgi:hypothetical protein